jgi:hypothetical protein
MSTGTKITCERVFYHYLDDTAIRIIKLGSDTYVWIQYGPTEGGLSVDVMKQYTRDEVIAMVEFLEPCGNIPAIELFNKFDKI